MYSHSYITVLRRTAFIFYTLRNALPRPPSSSYPPLYVSLHSINTVRTNVKTNNICEEFERPNTPAFLGCQNLPFGVLQNVGNARAVKL